MMKSISNIVISILLNGVLLSSFCITTITAQETTTGVTGSLVAKINERTDDETDGNSLSLFRDALQAVHMLDHKLGNTSHTYTVFAPTNDAIKASPIFYMYITNGMNETIPRWQRHLVHTLRHHMIKDSIHNQSDIFNSQRVELTSILETIHITQFDKTIQGGATLLEPDIYATNGVLHVITKVLEPKFFGEPFSKLELQKEYGPDHLQRTALVDVVDFVNGRSALDHTRPQGQTFVGCRIRAFNRLEEYLPYANNGSPLGVIKGEFLNITNKAQTIKEFIEYSIIPKNYYNDDIPNGFSEITIPIPNCGHMWVTKKNNLLCFNNGCVVAEEPDFAPREFVASNGIGYVIDKCQVCPGVAMLTSVAAGYTQYNLKDTAQFFGASEWNIRDLRRSVGDGTNVTLFAAITTGWDYFNVDDLTRLASDEWKPHQRDLLAHMLVQGSYTYAQLLERYLAEGPFNLTTLANQTIEVNLDDSKDVLTIANGEIIFSDLQGVDGYLHFITKLPLPISVTETVYDIAKANPEYKTHVSYIDIVRLTADLKRLSPLTAFYAPDSAFEGKVTEVEEIAKSVLESHLFEKLLWCKTIADLAEMGSTITSLNNQSWTISVGSNGLPCFDTYAAADGSLAKACIKKCDILARNGIVHELDNILLYSPAETRPPSTSDNFSPLPDVPTAPKAPTVFQRPSDSNTAPKSSPSSTGENGDDDISFGEGEQSGASVLSLSSFPAALTTVVVISIAIINIV